MSNGIEPDDDIERPINSDSLGAVGEGRFATICSGAELICNQGHRDRAGWDFIVEWPINHRNFGELDSRRNPISAHFQLKSMWFDNDRIKFRMTSLERLAKDPNPSFVYVTKFNHDQNVTEVYLCHMIGDNLSIVLKKLRELEAAGKKKINKEYLSIAASKFGFLIGPDGKALRAAVEQAVGSDLDAYYSEKARQLQELGYEPYRNAVSLTLKFKNEDEFTDAMLGLKKDIPFSSAIGRETRFGISLPSLKFPSEGLLSITPTPRDTCTITVRRRRFGVAATFEATILTAPRLDNIRKLGKVNINSQLFSLTIDERQFSFNSIEIEPRSPKLLSSQWANWYRFVEQLTVEGCTIEINPKRLKKQSLTFSGKINYISADQCEEALRIISDIELVLTSACGSASIVYGHESIARNDESSRVCAALVRGDRNLSVKLGLEEQIPGDTPDRLYGRFVDAIVLDEWAVIAVASATFVFDGSEERKYILAEDFNIEDLEIIEAINLADRIKIIQSDQNVGVCVARILTEESEDPPTEA